MNKAAILTCLDCKKKEVAGSAMFIPDLGVLNILGNLESVQQMIEFMDKHAEHLLIWTLPRVATSEETKKK